MADFRNDGLRPFRFFCFPQEANDSHLLERLERMAGAYFEFLTRQHLLNLRMAVAATVAWQESGYLEKVQIVIPGERVHPPEALFKSAMRISLELSVDCREGLVNAIQNCLQYSSTHQKEV